MPPGCPNPYFRPKHAIFHIRFQTWPLTSIPFLSFSLIHWELKRQVRLYALVVPLKTTPDFRHNGQNLYPLSDQNGSKTLPFGAAHTYIACMPPPPPDCSPSEEFASKVRCARMYGAEFVPAVNQESHTRFSFRFRHTAKPQ